MLGAQSIRCCKKKVHTYVCIILNCYQGLQILQVILLYFCLWGWIKGQVNKIKVETPDEFPACILDAAGCIKKRENQLRRTTRDLRTRVAKCSGVDGEYVNCDRFRIYV